MSDDAEQQVDPRIAWLEKAGINTEQVDPEYAGQGFQYWQSLNHRDHADATIEHTLRQRGYLPEGVSLDDVRRFAAEQQAQPDPWDSLAGQGEPQYAEEQQPYYEEPQPAPFDPRSLRPVFESEAQRMRQEIMNEITERQQREAYERDNRAEMERLRSEGLGQTAALGVIVSANELAATMPTASLRERVDASLKQFRSETDAYMAEQAKRQQQVNEQAKAIPSGPAPAAQQPAGSLEELLAREAGAA